MRIDLCICTYRRDHIRDTLLSVNAAQKPAATDLRVIVVDNDGTPSAAHLVHRTAAQMAVPVAYLHAPGANISVARNAGLEAVTGDWVAFLDDDETVEPDWLTALWARQRATGADGVFGISRAVYQPGAPDWMVAGDFHSQGPVLRHGAVETGHTCNGLLRWKGTPWADQRFDPGRGRSGGEDTEFFFRLRAMGAVYAMAEASITREAVPPDRATLDWLLRRRFRIGQSYAARATTLPARAGLFLSAFAKMVYCHLRALPLPRHSAAGAFWRIRGRMHGGVCAGCLNLRQRALYGEVAL